MVLYAGLLEEAHSRGLKSIDTTLHQIPSDANGHVAVCMATVEMEDGTTFSGIGDASPANVGKNIEPHLIRMAETRAKARALRDAVNVSAAVEGDADLESETVHDGERYRVERTGPRPVEVEGRPVDNGGNSATEKQLKFLESLIVEAKGEGGVSRFTAATGKRLSDLSAAEASGWINRLSGTAS